MHLTVLLEQTRNKMQFIFGRFGFCKKSSRKLKYFEGRERSTEQACNSYFKKPE